ncbi:MAG TPA: VOC family protein [Chitinophagaceae bacterium]
MKTNGYIPEGYNAVIPALAIRGAANAMEWYKKVFGAKEKMKFTDNEGKVMHGEITIGGNVIMVSEENLQYNKSPQSANGNSVNLCVYMPDVDAVLKKATDNGAKLLMPAKDEFYGDRSGRIEDPFGYVWTIQTHIKDVSEQEMKKIMGEMMKEA